jgi:hypothetical protein
VPRFATGLSAISTRRLTRSAAEPIPAGALVALQNDGTFCQAQRGGIYRRRRVIGIAISDADAAGQQVTVAMSGSRLQLADTIAAGTIVVLGNSPGEYTAQAASTDDVVLGVVGASNVLDVQIADAFFGALADDGEELDDLDTNPFPPLPAAWDPRHERDAIWISAAHTRYMFQEETEIVESRVSAAGQSVGEITDLGDYGFRAKITTAARRPTWRDPGGGEPPHLEFDGSADFMRFEGAERFLGCMLTDRVGGMAMHIRLRSDGSTTRIFDATANTNGNAGIRINRLSTGGIQATISDGTNNATATSTNTAEVADGFVWVLFWCDGADLNVRVGGVTDTVTNITASSVDVFHHEPVIGANSALSAYADVDVAHVILKRGVFDSAFISSVEGWTLPDSNSDRMLVRRDDADGRICSMLRTWFKATDVTTLRDAGGAEPDADEAVDVMRAAHDSSDANFLNQHATASDADARPVYRTASPGGLDFDGSDDTFELPSTRAIQASVWSFFVVAGNEDTDQRSSNHLLGGSCYVASTSHDKVDLSPNGGEPYWLFHTSPGGVAPGVGDLVRLAGGAGGDGSGVNILEHRGDLGDYAWDTEGTDPRTATEASTGLSFNRIGEGVSADTWQHGHWLEFRLIADELTDAEMAYVREQLQAEHGLT